MFKYDLIVIGGGASGLLAAGRAAELGARVLILEKNARLGEKLLITGGGRCNITNAERDDHILLKKYGRAEPFLYSLFAQFGVQSTFDFFQSRGLPLVVEAGGRAFPQTEKAADVLAVLTDYLSAGGVEVKTGQTVSQILVADGLISGVTCGSKIYQAKNYLLATGSLSHPETGSTGDGFKWLRDLGHTIVEPTPTLVPLAVAEKWVKTLAGLSLSDTKIIFLADGKRQFSLKGKILFTHFGLSGPLILNNASKVADLFYLGPVSALIDLWPKTDLGTLEKKVIVTFDANKNKSLKNILADLVPAGFAKGLEILLAGQIDLVKKVHSVTKAERKILVHLLKACPLSITGLMGFDRAVVADGGLPLEEIDLRTMRSKKIPNLLVTGDLLHINRPSGGYSLQLCWSTGFVAGSHLADQKS